MGNQRKKEGGTMGGGRREGREGTGTTEEALGHLPVGR